MTRATAHQKRYRIEMMGEGTFYNFIDQIFDEFDEQICNNCMFVHEHSELDALYCELEVSCDYSLGQEIIVEDFGCNKFEPK